MENPRSFAWVGKELAKIPPPIRRLAGIVALAGFFEACIPVYRSLFLNDYDHSGQHSQSWTSLEDFPEDHPLYIPTASEVCLPYEATVLHTASTENIKR